MRGMQELAILSPHFDDGVLSCGGRIWQNAAAGVPVRVMTLFAGGARGNPPPFARVQHAMWGDPPDANRLRRAEDVAAHSRLGCFDLYHLDEPDAVYRVGANGVPLYDSEQAIFGDIHPEEEGYARALADMVRAYLPAEARVLAPLGVGGHVDHRIGRAVGQLLLEEGWPLAFYEELPYVEREGTLERVLTPREAWRAEMTEISEEALSAKVEALAYYRSQIPVLYGGDLAMSRRVRAVANRVAGGTGYAERLWWPGGEEWSQESEEA